MTLADGLQRERGDNFLLLRHVAAALLIYSHSYALAPSAGGRSDLVAGLLPGLYGGKVAVMMFFAISGFLVTSSYLRQPRLARFLAARVLRIYPAYLACLSVTVLATGFCFTTLPAGEFFAHAQTRDYFVHNLGLAGLRYRVPGAFEASGYPNVLNGSLWSLALEVRLYLYLAVLALAGFFRWRLLAATVLALAVVAVLVAWPQLAPDDEGKRALTLIFATTAAAACAARFAPVSTRLLVLIVAAALLLRDTPLFHGIEVAGVAYATLWFAYRVPPLPLRLPGDYSYGLFLYGFPVQQALVSLFPQWQPLTLAGAALAATALLAVLSWHLIEARALALKPTRIAGAADRKAEHHGIEG